MTTPHRHDLRRRLSYQWEDDAHQIWTFRVDTENVRIIPPDDNPLASYWLFPEWKHRGSSEIVNAIHAIINTELEDR